MKRKGKRGLWLLEDLHRLTFAASNGYSPPRARYIQRILPAGLPEKYLPWPLKVGSDVLRAVAVKPVDMTIQ